MTRSRSKVCPRRDVAIALVAACVWWGTPVQAGGQAEESPPLGHGAPVASYDEVTRCEAVIYRGPETRLYSNRPYHTSGRAEAAVGLQFCQGPRHGAQLWIVEASAPTMLLAFGADAFGLADHGWTPHLEPVRVEAAGQPLDRIYTREIPAGRHIVRQAFARTAIVVLWDPEVVRVAP